MNKNILALGLIAVISGISTAQTYTATAGTNGVIDIQSDYSMSTGDGASVSVDVPLEFELPKKVAIAISTNGTATLPALPEFDGIVPSGITKLSNIVSLVPYNSSSFNNMSSSNVRIVGGIYTNTEAIVTVNKTDYIHEADNSSNMKARSWFCLGSKDSNVDQKLYGCQADDNDSNTTVFPASITIDTANAIANDNQISFVAGDNMYLDTIDPSDRAGKYISTATVTVSTL